MKAKQLRNILFTTMPAALLALTACSSSEEKQKAVESTSTTETTKGVPGGTMVNTHTLTARVTGVDAINRRVTVQTKDGNTRVIKAGPEVRNFNQIQVGDQVNATLVEQLVVFMRRPSEGAPLTPTSRDTSVAVAPQGARPGAVIVDTIETTAKVVALDEKSRHASLQFPDGTVRVVKVRPDVDMTKAKLGDEVVIRSTEDLAIKVEKP